MKLFIRYVGVMAGLLPLAAAAADYPAKPIRVIVPWPAGGSTDTLARIVGQRLTTITGQPTVIDNRAGAAGTIGVDMASKSTPDGYTITIVEAAHAVLPATTKGLPYDLSRDLAPLTLIGVSPNIVYMSSAVPAKNLNEFVALAKAKPGALPAAHTGIGSFSHLALELLQARTGTKFNQIGYKGGAPAMVELAGGQVYTYLATLATGSATLKTGRIKAVAICGAKRIDALPDVPTTSELGLRDMIINQWWGYVAPSNVPRAVIAQLHKDLVTAIDHPFVRERAAELAVDVTTTTTSELKTYIAGELQRWEAIARDTGMKAQ